MTTHPTYQPGETVAAIATPPGEGGVAIVRISGSRAVEVAARVYSGDVRAYATHTVHFGHVLDPKGNRVDDVLLIKMLSPRSYTGEDVVEIHCHGGSLISRRVLDLVLDAGARQSYPGEFTFKAYMNGKLDLAQAEAVQELIGAKNERALEAAKEQLHGMLSKRISGFTKGLTEVAAILEAWVDFPEEDLAFASFEEVCGQLEGICFAMQELLNTYHDGRIVHEGLSLCLVGSPNVGKSSLMNALLDKERAIVSHVPGTTRDLIEDHLRLNGLNLRVIDTAGIRESEELIEQEGIRRSHAALAEADLALLVLDATQPLGLQEQDLFARIPAGKAVVVWNKVDLPHEKLPILPLGPNVRVSAKEKSGLDQLRQAIDKVIWEHGPPSKEETLITNVRHKEALAHAVTACRAVIHGLHHGVSPEFLAADMRACLQELARILGTDVTEDILSAIFSKFCVGK